MHGFQLWANLPAAHKMMTPATRDPASQIPEVRDADGGTVKVIAGNLDGVTGPVRDVVTGPEYLDVSLPRVEASHAPRRAPHGLGLRHRGQAVFCQQRNPFAYDAEGSSYFDLERSPAIGDRHLVVFGDGEQVIVGAEEQPARFLLISGQPLGEPIPGTDPRHEHETRSSALPRRTCAAALHQCEAGFRVGAADFSSRGPALVPPALELVWGSATSLSSVTKKRARAAGMVAVVGHVRAPVVPDRLRGVGVDLVGAERGIGERKIWRWDDHAHLPPQASVRQGSRGRDGASSERRRGGSGAEKPA
jgi:hypothetical protein